LAGKSATTAAFLLREMVMDAAALAKLNQDSHAVENPLSAKQFVETNLQ
jgi:hypothetical protein